MKILNNCDRLNSNIMRNYSLNEQQSEEFIRTLTGIMIKNIEE